MARHQHHGTPPLWHQQYAEHTAHFATQQSTALFASDLSAGGRLSCAQKPCRVVAAATSKLRGFCSLHLSDSPAAAPTHARHIEGATSSIRV